MRFFWITLLLWAAAAMPAQAKTTGFYLGGGIGPAFIESNLGNLDEQDVRLEEEKFAWKLFGGYRYRFVALEADYRDLGEVRDTFRNYNLSSKTTGFDLLALGLLPLGPVDLFGKAGLFFWNTDQQAVGRSDDRSGTDPAWGLGLGFRVWRLAVRFEFEKFEVELPDNLYMFSLGGAFLF
jgi:hypothetical protein